MREAITYILIVVLCWPSMMVGFLVIAPIGALLHLVRVPVSVYRTYGPLIAGIGSVAAAMACGIGLFRLIVGPASFGLWPFVATTAAIILVTLSGLRRGSREFAAAEAHRAEVAAKRARETSEEAKAFLSHSEQEWTYMMAYPSYLLWGRILGLAGAAWIFWK